MANISVDIKDLMIAALNKELENLKHDIARHIEICASLSTENQELRAKVDRLEKDLEDAFKHPDD